MPVVVDLILLVAVVTTVGGIARRWDLPAPLLLVVVGIAGSFLPRFDGFRLSPEVVLVGILPPLLYATAIRTSLVDLRTSLRPILALAVGLVVLTTLGVGAAVWLALPVPLAAALALGAVVAPPDAVAATSIARRLGLPRVMVTVLEGESLLNDATALVCLNAAVAAIAGAITPGEVALDFAVSAVGGVVVGGAVGKGVAWVRSHVDDSLTDTAIALVTPFSAYVLAEEAHASGVLAVVVAGLLLGERAHVVQSARSRMLERSTWATVQFLLENSVFLLIGLQLRTILDEVVAGDLGAARITVASVVAVAAVVVLRIVGVQGSAALLFRGRSPSWRALMVPSWAGMRGVVTLAAVFALPEGTPHREALVLIAFVVTAATLLGQGFTLPAVIRWARLPADDSGADLLHRADLMERAGRAGAARLDEVADPDALPAAVRAKLMKRSGDRSNAAWEELGGTDETPAQAYTRLRLEMLRAERDEVLRLRREGAFPQGVVASVLAVLDVEESLLDVAAGQFVAEQGAELALAGREECVHLARPVTEAAPRTPEGCEECLAIGAEWVHLRLCQECGHVGCCDSSEGAHAAAHFAATGHPVMRSFEAGEAWRWCYVDSRLG